MTFGKKNVWRDQYVFMSHQLFSFSPALANLKLENSPVTGTCYEHRAERSPSEVFSDLFKVGGTRGLV